MKLDKSAQKYVGYAVAFAFAIILGLGGASLMPITSPTDSPYSNQVIGVGMIVSAVIVVVFIFFINRRKK